MSFQIWHRHQTKSKHAVRKRAVLKPTAQRIRANAKLDFLLAVANHF